ncbi:glycoprotease family-domain-containing protein [Phaeosphaeria sp. MPI-PUGE-AT-0046c]|nr:glycoprotease family-domain-containing protein [Phaeosphaeria sp. MPI-PUGE-AT-0046c]
MSHRVALFKASTRAQRSCRPKWNPRRCLMTLAIETSCDDTSVAILERKHDNRSSSATLHFHKKVTSNNAEFQGVHPLVSLRSHQENLASLLSDAISHLPPKKGDHGGNSRDDAGHGNKEDDRTAITTKTLPDFISVTRGPGMRSNLFTGLDTAKGLAVAWQIPLVGVHHMQAHALTPRLVSALKQPSEAVPEPAFPFLSVLASGGHTLVIHSASLTEHRLLGTTNDIAVGECLDKVARILLPPELLQSTRSTMYGALLERFAFKQDVHPVDAQGSKGSCSSRPQVPANVTGYSAKQYLETYSRAYHWYNLPSNHEEALMHNVTKWGWSLNQPLITATKAKSVELSFAGLLTAVERVIRYETDASTKKQTKTERALDHISLEEKQAIARETMRAAFEHVAYRTVLALRSIPKGSTPGSVVLAGGVAANSFMRHILASTLCAHGFSGLILHFPPPDFCTDNAAMIAWTGLEMFEAGHANSLSIRAIRKWPLDQLLEPVEDG